MYLSFNPDTYVCVLTNIHRFAFAKTSYYYLIIVSNHTCQNKKLNIFFLAITSINYYFLIFNELLNLFYFVSMIKFDTTSQNETILLIQLTDALFTM